MKNHIFYDEKVICEDYKIIKSSRKVATKNGISHVTVQKILRKNSITMTGPPLLHQLNEDYFKEIDSEGKAYWLGFIAADGCVYIKKDKVKYFSLVLKESDCFHLEKFVKAIGSNFKVKKQKNRNSVVFQFINKRFVENLLDKNIIPNKTYLFTWPKIDDENLVRHFIRGYFDGDGCWSIYKGKVNFSLIGTDYFTDKCQDFLVKKIGLNKIKRYSVGKNRIAKSIVYGGNWNCKKIYDFLYNDSDVFLERKKNKVKKILADYEKK